jgi:hypothetical protein
MHAPPPGPQRPHAAPTVPLADLRTSTRTHARPDELQAWLDEFELAGPPPDWPAPARAGARAGRGAAVVLALVLIASLPPLAGWLAAQRPRIVDADVAAYAAEPPAGTPTGQGQPPVPFDELLALLAANRAAPGAPPPDPTPAPPAGQRPAAGPQAPQAEPGPAGGRRAVSGGDELARAAAALVRIGRGGGSAADAARVCAVVSCAALGAPPDQAMVRRLFGAIDDGLVGPAEAASAMGLPTSQAGRLLDAIAAARGA